MNLFDPFPQRSLSLRNRLAVSPMCEYSAIDGVPNDWHMVHLGSRAVGGAGAVIAEATAVSAQGRISPQDTGLWNQAQVEAWQPIARFIKSQGAIAGVQLAHAGRKASTLRPWEGNGPVPAGQGDWQTVAPSALLFDEGWQTPQALDEAGIAAVIADFRATAQRALAAGFELIELHAAHGYLLHQFLSPLSNQRSDRYGAVSTTAAASCARSSQPCARYGLTSCRCGCVSPPPIGRRPMVRAAGMSNRACSWRSR